LIVLAKIADLTKLAQLALFLQFLLKEHNLHIAYNYFTIVLIVLKSFVL